MPGNFDQLRSRDIRRRIAAGLDRDERIIHAMMITVGALIRLSAAAVAVHQRCGYLSGKAAR